MIKTNIQNSLLIINQILLNKWKHLQGQIKIITF